MQQVQKSSPLGARIPHRARRSIAYIYPSPEPIAVPDGRPQQPKYPRMEERVRFQASTARVALENAPKGEPHQYRCDTVRRTDTDFINHGEHACRCDSA